MAGGEGCLEGQAVRARAQTVVVRPRIRAVSSFSSRVASGRALADALANGSALCFSKGGGADGRMPCWEVDWEESAAPWTCIF